MNAVSEIKSQGAITTQNTYDPYAAYGQEAASTGAFLKFSKGEWLLGQNDDEIALGRRLVANMDELSIGWIRWADGKPAERRLGLLSQGFKPEPRDELGYTEQSDWELDDEGRPKDPWNFTNELPMADPEDGEQMTFSASSKGGIGAVGNLCKAYGREYRQRAGQVPVIELGRDSYKHAKYGKTYVPILKIVDWVENGSVPAPATASNDDDAVSGSGAAAETPPAQKAGGAKAATKF